MGGNGAAGAKREAFPSGRRADAGGPVSHAGPLQTEDGAWVEYDNSLTEETMTPEEAAEALAEEPSIQQTNAMALTEQLTADDLTEYVNRQSDLPARLAKMAKQNKMFTLTKDGQELSWGV